jgi:SPP1 gp7 family putative phage head morphogenesis protein
VTAPLAIYTEAGLRSAIAHAVHGRVYAEWDESKHPRHPAGAPESQGGEFAPKFDKDEGIGNTPNGMDIDYFGHTRTMPVAEFLRLAANLPENQIKQDTLSYLRGAIREGKAFAPPFLKADWDDTNKQWRITDHEGRHRSLAILREVGNIDIPVQVFGPMRARSLTPEMKGAPFVSQDTVERDALLARAKKFLSVDGGLKEQLDTLEARSLDALSDALEISRDALLARVRNSKQLAKLVRDLTLPREPLILMEVRAMLDRAWDAGQRDARAEVREGKREYASSFIPKLAVSFLRSSAFYITGLIASKILSEAKGIILNGIKTGKPTLVMVQELADAIGAQFSQARLETIVRTNTTAAYNHGRLTYFMDKDVIPFLKGVRYSAILDERTTPVCDFLHGKVFKPSDQDLTALLPPNHFNCRSVVVPIVAGEKIDASEFITPSEIGQARELADAKFLDEKQEAREYKEPE